MEYELTDHVKERYAERIQGKQDKADARAFIARHETKIYEDIEKMIEHGTVIYEGSVMRIKETSYGRFILCNDWLIVVNPQNKKVVTLYRIDLGAGDEINKMYIQTMVEKLEKARIRVAEKVNVIKQIEESYNRAIQENTELIQDYKKKIKSLEDQNEALSKLLLEERTNISIAEEEMRDIISVFTSGTKF